MTNYFCNRYSLAIFSKTGITNDHVDILRQDPTAPDNYSIMMRKDYRPASENNSHAGYQQIQTCLEENTSLKEASQKARKIAEENRLALLLQLNSDSAERVVLWHPYKWEPQSALSPSTKL